MEVGMRRGSGATGEQQGFVRGLGLFDATMVVAGSMIGSASSSCRRISRGRWVRGGLLIMDHHGR
jgi:hypothetical protein